jgi:hypothetical protein
MCRTSCNQVGVPLYWYLTGFHTNCQRHATLQDYARRKDVSGPQAARSSKTLPLDLWMTFAKALSAHWDGCSRIPIPVGFTHSFSFSHVNSETLYTVGQKRVHSALCHVTWHLVTVRGTPKWSMTKITLLKYIKDAAFKNTSETITWKYQFQRHLHIPNYPAWHLSNKICVCRCLSYVEYCQHLHKLRKISVTAQTY